MIFKRRKSLAPLLVFITLLALVVVLAYVSFAGVRNTLETSFERAHSDLVAMINNRIEEHLTILFVQRDFYAASDEVTRDEFSAFFSDEELLRRFPGLQAVAATDYVRGEDLGTYINSVRNDRSLKPEGHPDFSVFPPGERAEYYIANFVEPQTPENLPAFGFDLYSTPERSEAIDRAHLVNEMVLTQPLTLVKDDGTNTMGFLGILPIYENDAPVDTLEDRLLVNRGIAAAAFEAPDFFEGLITDSSGLAQDLHYTIHDIDPRSGEELFLLDSAYHESGEIDDHQERYTASDTIVVGGRQWRITSHEAVAFASELRLRMVPFLILIVGFVLSGVFSYVIYIFSSTRERAIAIANTMTKNLRKANLRLDLATKSAKIGVWEWNVKDNSLDFDDRMYELYGLDRETFDSTYAGWTKTIHPDDIDAIESEIQSILTTQGILDLVLRAVLPDESIRYIQAYGTVVCDDSGQADHLVGVNWDVTKEQEVDRAKSEFVSLASHQLRSPLSTISWYSEMLLDQSMGELSQQQQEYLDIIHERSLHMTDLVNALLNVSRLELGMFVLNPVELPLREFIPEQLEDFLRRAQMKGVNLHTDLHVSDTFVFDQGLLEIVVQNIVSNAVKYTPHGGVADVSVFAVSGSLRITVRDTGMGIPVSQQQNIFNKHFRADNVLRAQIQGTGLGLYLVKLIVDYVGGTIEFSSQEGVGTEFRVTLPELDDKDS